MKRHKSLSGRSQANSAEQTLHNSCANAVCFSYFRLCWKLASSPPCLQEERGGWRGYCKKRSDHFGWELFAESLRGRVGLLGKVHTYLNRYAGILNKPLWDMFWICKVTGVKYHYSIWRLLLVLLSGATRGEMFSLKQLWIKDWHTYLLSGPLVFGQTYLSR